MNGIQSIPPKTLMILAERAKRLDGCIRLHESQIYEFPQPGNIVAVLIDPENPTGHVGRDPYRHKMLTEELAKRKAAREAAQ